MAKGFGTGKPKKSKQYQKSYVNFLLEVLQATQESNGNSKVIYPLLQANLDKLDDNFAQLLHNLARDKLSTVEPKQAQRLALDIFLFSNIIQNFPLGSRASNLEIVITGYEIITTIFTRNTFPEVLAMAQNALGVAYFNRIFGDKVDNLERAIHWYGAALQIYIRDTFPEKWADTQNNLGVTYRSRILGDKAENLESAIQYLEAALQIYTREAFSKDWAMTQNNLGNVYKDRILGNRADNLEQAIRCYKAVLQVLTRDTFPQDWAATQNNLGNVYTNRILGDKAENQEQAIRCYEAALQIRIRDTFPQDWALTHNNLGTAYRNRILGNQAENLESAIRCYEAALEVYTSKVFPQDWAMLQYNLGVAYTDRIYGDKELNLELAIRCYDRALQVFTPEGFPQNWAMLQHNLGFAYSYRISEGLPEELELAIPQGTLGELIAWSMVGEIWNLKLAIRFYEAALQVLTCEAFPRDWAMLQHNFGNVYLKLQQIPQAVQAFQQALKIYTPAADPISCIVTGRGLGYAAFKGALWQEAIEGFGAVIEAVETSRSWAASESRRQEILAEAFDVYENMVQACINDGQLEKALETVERSRSKRLVDLMASNDLYQSGEIPLEVKKLLQQFDDLQQRIDQERSQNSSGNNRELIGVGSRTSDRASFQAKTQAIASLEAEKQQIWEQLRRLDPVLAGEIQVIAPDFSAMQKLIDQPTTAILSFYSTSNNTHIFVLRKNQLACHACTGQGIETLQNWISQKWLKLYVEEENTWKSQIINFLAELAERLQINDLISQHLQDITELILVPHLALHQIPFAALPLGEGQYLGDKFLIRYTPSCQVLEFCQQRGEVEGNLTYGTVEDATEDLPFANFEGEQIAKVYNIPESARLRGRSQATTSNYRQLASRVQVLHSSHHAEFCLDNPLNSQLKLADGNITLGQLMTPGWRLPNLSDVFLSCCETGLGLPEITDDILTLSTGFLCSGARSVVSTLWSVDDLATALFSIFYYQHRQPDKSRPESLRQAQIKLRELRKEELLKREDIQELSTQAEAGRKEARSKRSQYQPGSADFLKWNCEYRKYAGVTNQIHALKNSQDECPFSPLHYWAAFTCQGLR
ncbi:CHAT domain-containing protein [Trichocoleus sp. DQ-A3]|uniref:CHAT domain-containing protein n=1 Tax=Cyanophyceae TaxID=3028117 RepID=UPI001681D870|nr:CHAT domain-containing tetratricopeptide repeat protein [Coleofasciculus sp. FACHB-125]MBD1901378.1 CHAT domain-containing protein [Coleofasciculus sp. FACHB-125]